MGSPMVSRLLENGQHDVVLYARRPQVCDQHVERGAHRAESLKELAETSDILLACLFSEQQLRETALGIDGFAQHLREGAVFASHTTASPVAVQDIAEASPWVHVVDAPVSGDAVDIERGRLTVMLGGDPDAIETTQQVVSAYADPVIVTGALGSPSMIKLLNNLLFAANSQLLAATVATGRSMGLDQDLLLAALSACSGASAALQRVRQVGGLEAFEERVTPYLRKDVTTAIAVAQQLGLAVDLVGDVVEKGPLAIA